MKRQVIWGITVALGLALIVAFCLNPTRETTDWANWASALGTVAAVFAAVWATFAAEDRQHRDALKAAHITSVAVASIASRLADELEKIEVSLENMQLNGAGRATVALTVTRIEGLLMPSEDQLLRLAHAPGGMAVEIANALAGIKYASSLLSPAELEPLGRDDETRSKEGARRARTTINSARTALRKAVDEIASFSATLKT